jgi:hypothetical protein
MQEYWFCETCKSMNRGDADNCYRCRAPRARATMATIHERHLEGVMMPGFDKLEPGVARAMLAQHPYNPAWPYAYASVALLIPPIAFQVGLLLYEVAYLIALVAPDRYSMGATWSLVLAICLGGFGASLVLAGVVHSIFLGLTDMNVPSLGGGEPRFAPPRAFAWWIESGLWALRANLTVWGPLAIGLKSMEVVGLFGLAFALMLLTVTTRYFHNPLYSLGKPARLLEDLIARLALRGSSDRGLASMWSGAWSTARLIDVITPLVVVVGAIVMVVASFIQMTREAFGTAPASELNYLSSFYTLAALLVLLVVAEVVANIIALLLLARITLSLSDSQRARRQWVVQSAGRDGTLAGHAVGVTAPATYPAAGSAARSPWTPPPPEAPDSARQWKAQEPAQPILEPASAVQEPGPDTEEPAPVVQETAAVPPRPRWITVQAQVAGEVAGEDTAADATVEWEPFEPPRLPELAQTEPPPAERPPAAPEPGESPPAPPEPLGPPQDQAPAESAKPVLRPSSTTLTRYRVPNLPSLPDQPASPAEDQSEPFQPDWPEGI